MKKIFIGCLATAIAFLLFTSFNDKKTKMKPATFNHIALYVQDLKKSSEFYSKILGLEKIDEPFKDGRHDWYRIGDHCQLHLIGGNTNSLIHIKDTHLAYSVEDLDEFIKLLEKEKVNYSNWPGTGKIPTPRADGVKQVYFQDPDGYWIEVNNDRY